VSEPSAAGKVLVFGSINVDTVFNVDEFPQPGETRGGAEVLDSLGGKGANQAVAAARQQASVVMVGCVGQDAGGDLALGQLRSEGVDVSECRRVADVATGRAGVVVDGHGENMIVVADGANAELGPDDATRSGAQLGSAGVVVAQLETPVAGVAAAFREARAAGVRTILNAAPAGELGADVTDLVDVLMVNRVEAAALARSSGADAQADIRMLADSLGIEVIVVTMGARGALVWHEGAAGEIPAPLVDAVDSTGAGDAFVGAFAQALADGARPEPAARRACTAGALAATRRGAMPAIPLREEVEAELANRSEAV
jgi:ribokinase